MRKFLVVVAALGSCLCGSAAHASIADGSKITISRTANHVGGESLTLYGAGNVYVDPPVRTFGGRGGGGEFLITEQLVPTPEVFKTFCLEKTEHITLNGTYWVTLDSIAYYGSGGGGPLGDPLGDATKWLYYWYITGTLDTEVTGYKYDQAFSSNELQAAIWELEGDGPATNPLGVSLKNAALAEGVWDSDLGDVLVLNLWTSPNPTTTTSAQSQLYFRARSGGTDIVPEPLSVAIWGTLAGVGIVVQWRRRKAD